MKNITLNKKNVPLSINSPTTFGVRPSAPFLFKVAATGDGPLTYSAINLPDGLSINLENGIISGKISGNLNQYDVKLIVESSIDKSEQDFTIIVGETICLTPPMGWNSWYCHSELISEDAVKETATAMAKKGLINHGWTYINIDDCWQGERGGKYGAIQPNERFKDMKGLCDFVHSLGLKIGIYSTPWIGTYAGFLGGSNFKDQDDLAKFYLPESERLQETQFFGRWPGSIDKGLGQIGEQWLFNCDVKQWAEWGIDYVKVDWEPNDIPTTKRIYQELRECGRDIILSLSNNAPFENGAGLAKYANCWRTTGDIKDQWESMSNIAFSQERWTQFSNPGHWNDPDMLQVGNLATPNQQNKLFRSTNLTPDEQHTQVSLWCLLSAPLMLSCDITSMDEFTLDLLTNDEVIAINQDSDGNKAYCVVINNKLQLWKKHLSDGGLAVGIFNLDDSAQEFILTSEIVEIERISYLRNLWSHKDIPFAEKCTFTIPPHGVVLLKAVLEL